MEPSTTQQPRGIIDLVEVDSIGTRRRTLRGKHVTTSACDTIALRAFDVHLDHIKVSPASDPTVAGHVSGEIVGPNSFEIRSSVLREGRWEPATEGGATVYWEVSGR